MADEVSALMQALYTDDTAKVDELLAAGPELDVFEAAALGRVDRLGELLGANPELAQAWSPDRARALHFAAFFRQPEATRLLVERGADLNDCAFDDYGPTPLDCAVWGWRNNRTADGDYRGTVEVLVGAGAPTGQAPPTGDPQIDALLSGDPHL